jgi:hypothetical protein
MNDQMAESTNSQEFKERVIGTKSMKTLPKIILLFFN